MIARQFQEVAAKLTDEALTPLASNVSVNLDEIATNATAAIEAFDAPFRRAAEFGKQISSNLADAIVNGQNLGTALVNSFKAAAAEALASGLFKLLLGDGTAGGSGLLSGAVTAISSFFGGARANGGPVSAGSAYLVGERGPELIVPNASGYVIANNKMGGGGGSTAVVVDVQPSPFFVTTVTQVAQSGGAQAAGAVLRRAQRGNLMQSRGA
jgi:phage-related minor tail protein